MNKSCAQKLIGSHQCSKCNVSFIVELFSNCVPRNVGASGKFLKSLESRSLVNKYNILLTAHNIVSHLLCGETHAQDFHYVLPDEFLATTFTIKTITDQIKTQFLLDNPFLLIRSVRKCPFVHATQMNLPVNCEALFSKQLACPSARCYLLANEINVSFQSQRKNSNVSCK